MAPSRWLPLESNPDVINKYLFSLGIPDGIVECVDVYGLDSVMLAMVPQPVVALLLLFPITPNYEVARSEEQEKLSAAAGDQKPSHGDVYFTKQTVGNACGTVAVIHSVANNLERIPLTDDSFLRKFINETEQLEPTEKAEKLELDEGIAACHGESALDGQTDAPSAEEKVDLHFISLVHKNGRLYELDGRKEFPIDHGATKKETFLEDGAAVVKKFVALDPEEHNFNVMALTLMSS